MQARNDQKAQQPWWKLLLWTTIAGLIFGLIGVGEIAEDYLRALRNNLHTHQASGDIVIVAIDDDSIRKVGRWPWPRRYHAQLTDRLTEAGADRIFFDISFFGATDAADDQAFADALKRSGRVVLAAQSRYGAYRIPNGNVHQDALPLDIFRKSAEVGTISWQYNYQNAVWQVPYALEMNGEVLSSFSSLLAGRTGQPDNSFTPDYSLDPRSIPTISAAVVINGNFDPEKVRGKQVIIGTTTNLAGDAYFVPGIGQMGGVYVHIIAAETLKNGIPRQLGWIPLFLVTLGLTAAVLLRANSRRQSLILAGMALALLFGPAAFEARLIFVDMMPALLVLTLVASVILRRQFRQRGFVNAVSGLPNLTALRAYRKGRDQTLIAARILNYAEVAASLPANGERQLIDQIVGRLKVGAAERTLYHGDDGIFAWFEESRLPFGHHLEALYALFRTPAKVAGQQIDLSITFGVEIGSGRSLANRLGSALVAADEAAHDGLKWKYHDPESLQHASWKLSMLSQLDAAVDKGEIWVAYQPQIDLKTRRIVGAEALARWTHPEKGPIAASEFISAAEQHDRIGKLTDFVLDQAIASAATVNRRHPGFTMAVNLSAKLLSDQGFVLRLAAALARHKLKPELLTLELTETATLSTHGETFDVLAALLNLGVTISIDDYGTGLSTLEYLKKIPATELKIDQSFVKGMVDNRSDRLMVQSTIALAHSLGRKVVAEGVERNDILDALSEVECDLAQGFAIGRPMSIDSLSKRLASDRKRQVA